MIFHITPNTCQLPVQLDIDIFTRFKASLFTVCRASVIINEKVMMNQSIAGLIMTVILIISLASLAQLDFSKNPNRFIFWASE